MDHGRTQHTALSAKGRLWGQERGAGGRGAERLPLPPREAGVGFTVIIAHSRAAASPPGPLFILSGLVQLHFLERAFPHRSFYRMLWACLHSGHDISICSTIIWPVKGRPENPVEASLWIALSKGTVSLTCKSQWSKELNTNANFQRKSIKGVSSSSSSCSPKCLSVRKEQSEEGRRQKNRDRT